MAAQVGNTTENIVLDDLFLVKEKDRDGKKFDKVSRIFAESENYGLNLILDVNSELYPLNQKDKFTLILARSLQSDGMGGASGMPVEAGYYDAGRGRSMADDYEYVMYGKVYKFDESQNQQRVQVLISFGGLLMSLEGEPRYLQDFDIGRNFYLLMRRAH